MRKKVRHPKKRLNNKSAITPADLSRITTLASAAGVQDDDNVKYLLRSVYYSRDPRVARVASEYLETLAIEQAIDPDPFAPPVDAGEAAGDIDLGVIINSGCLFGPLFGELVQHTLLVGSQGKGKTTAVRRLLRGILSLPPGVPCRPRILAFDIKGDYLPLAREFSDIHIFTPGTEDFRWNPLEPPISWKR